MAANLKDEIMAANVKFMYCFDTSDFDGLAALYTEDCKLMPTGSPVLVGRDGVKNVFSGVRKAAKSLVLTVQEVGPLDADVNTAFERSDYQFIKEDGSPLDTGKYVVIWKKVEGKWFLYTDIFNSNGSS